MTVRRVCVRVCVCVLWHTSGDAHRHITSHRITSRRRGGGRSLSRRSVVLCQTVFLPFSGMTHRCIDQDQRRSEMVTHLTIVRLAIPARAFPGCLWRTYHIPWNNALGFAHAQKREEKRRRRRLACLPACRPSGHDWPWGVLPREYLPAWARLSDLGSAVGDQPPKRDRSQAVRLTSPHW